MIKVPNEAALRAGVEHAQEYLEEWNQGSWANVDPGSVCGTTACLAGHILMAQGMPFHLLLHLGDQQQGWGVPLLAMNVLGFETDINPSADDYDSKDAQEFHDLIFAHVHDARAEGTWGSLRTTQEAFDLFKERVTEVTGIEL